jgi:hypothetical protein
MSDKECEHIKRDGLCFFCKEKGHMAYSCPKKKPSNSSSGSNHRGGTITVIGEGPGRKDPANVIKIQKFFYKATTPTKAHPTDAGYV